MLQKNRILRAFILVMLVLPLWYWTRPSNPSDEYDVTNEPVLTHSDRQQGIKHKSRMLGGPVSATFLVVMDSTEEFDMLEAIQSYESRFNQRHHYDWTFLSDKAFNPQFKDMATQLGSGKVTFNTIDRTEWAFPKDIDPDKAYRWRIIMQQLGLERGNTMDERHRSRFLSGFFFDNKALGEHDYYWRVEPKSRLTCDVNYDVFLFMKQNKKKFGFIAAEHGDDRRGPSVFQEALNFIHEYPELIPSNNSKAFVDYNEELDIKSDFHCEFWSHFEIGDLNWLRSDQYKQFFEYMDSKGGFYLENWSEAVFRTLASSLLLPLQQVHWFNDIGYSHEKSVCPFDYETRFIGRCTCNEKVSVTWNPKKYCMHKYFIVSKFERPKDWRDHLNRNLS